MLVQGLLVFLQQKSLKGEFEGRKIYFAELPFCWRVSHEGVAWEKAKGHWSQQVKLRTKVGSGAPAEGSGGSMEHQHSWVQQQSEGPRRQSAPRAGSCLSVRFFFAILSVSCFTPHPSLLVWLSHCLLSLILDRKNSGGGNTSLYSKQAVLLWH